MEMQSQRLIQARHAALALLIHEVKMRTEIRDFKLDDINKVRIAVTYLSPRLMEAVFQNHILAHPPGNPNFHETIRQFIEKSGEHDEHIFLMTVIANLETSMPHTVDMAPREMILRNTNDYNVTPLYEDHNLDLPINLSYGSEHGFLYFPESVFTKNGCESVLDRKRNTKINIEAQAIFIDGERIGPVIWTIYYAPLVDTGISFYTPEYPTPTVPGQSLSPGTDVYTPLTEPPTNSEKEDSFWRDFARFVWEQVTLEHH